MTLADEVTHEPGSDAWLEQRRSRLGGSEIAAVVGLSPFESPFSLWHRKSGMIAEQTDRPVMEWGRRLEAVVLDKWCEDRGITHRSGRGVTLVRDDWMIASPDWLDVDLLEIKTSPRGDDWGREDDDPEKAIPVYYQCQASWYMAVTDRPECHFAVLISGHDYREYTLPRDQEAIDYLTREGRAFLDSIEAGIRPDIDAHTRTYETIRQLHPDIADEDVEIGEALAEQWITAVRAKSAADEAHDLAKNLLSDAMGDAKRAFHDGQKLADRRARPGGTPYLQKANGLTKSRKEIAA